VHLVVDDCRNQDATRIGKSFEAGGDVDAITVNVAVLDDDVAEIDADTELNALCGRDVGITLGHTLLHCHRAGDGFDNAGKLDKEAVSGGLDNATLVNGDLRIDQLAPVGSEPREGTLLVGTHQP
jgi:hypothetical protein